MRKITVAGSVVALLVAAAACQAQAPPEMPKPAKEHEWLRQLVGEWDTQAEAVLGPDQPPLKCEGTETVRAIGDFWILTETRGTMPGLNIPVTGLMTLGYDPEKKKYVGTWVDSTSSQLWTYEGTLDETGKILTLNTEGPNPIDPGKRAKYREVLELKDKDHKVFSSSMQTDDGQWHKFMTINYHRKK